MASQKSCAQVVPVETQTPGFHQHQPVDAGSLVRSLRHSGYALLAHQKCTKSIRRPFFGSTIIVPKHFYTFSLFRSSACAITLSSFFSVASLNYSARQTILQSQSFNLVPGFGRQVCVQSMQKSGNFRSQRFTKGLAAWKA